MDLNKLNTTLLLSAVNFYLNELQLRSCQITKEKLLYPETGNTNELVSILEDIDAYKKLKKDLEIIFNKHIGLNE